MLKMIGNEINAILGAQTILIWTYLDATIIWKFTESDWGSYIFWMKSDHIYTTEYQGYLEVHDEDGIIHVPLRYEITPIKRMLYCR